jgi:hypothetical protein
MFFIADLIACSTCFGHHSVHHQELESITPVVAACGVWCFCFQVVDMVWSWGLCVRFKQQPETCWASNKICNKNHLLHLVGILFPHKATSFITTCLVIVQIKKIHWNPLVTQCWKWLMLIGPITVGRNYFIYRDKNWFLECSDSECRP